MDVNPRFLRWNSVYAKYCALPFPYYYYYFKNIHLFINSLRLLTRITSKIYREDILVAEGFWGNRGSKSKNQAEVLQVVIIFFGYFLISQFTATVLTVNELQTPMIPDHLQLTWSQNSSIVSTSHNPYRSKSILLELKLGESRRCIFYLR